MENQTPPRKLSQKKKQSIKNSLLVTKYTMSGNIKRLKNLLYVTIGLNIIFGLLFIANDFIFSIDHYNKWSSIRLAAIFAAVFQFF